jgi:RNA polymerase sigma-70 factor (ECF subfamily)
VARFLDCARREKAVQQDDSDDLLALQRTLRGESQAFDFIVKKYTPILYSLCYRMTDSREAAEEAVQEILLRVYRSLGRFRLGKRFYPWIYTIAVNYLRSSNRKRKKTQRIREVPFQDSILNSRSKEHHTDPIQNLEHREGERLAAEALATLRPAYREVFVLRQMEGLSVREVSEVLDIPEGTVKTYLHRARMRLIEILTSQGWNET